MLRLVGQLSVVGFGCLKEFGRGSLVCLFAESLFNKPAGLDALAARKAFGFDFRLTFGVDNDFDRLHGLGSHVDG